VLAESAVAIQSLFAFKADFEAKVAMLLEVRVACS
jgi:hypothetical protein